MGMLIRIGLLTFLGKGRIITLHRDFLFTFKAILIISGRIIYCIRSGNTRNLIKTQNRLVEREGKYSLCKVIQ